MVVCGSSGLDIAGGLLSRDAEVTASCGLDVPCGGLFP